MTAPASHRLGQPSPLPFHLGTAALAYAQALQLAPLAGSGAVPLHDDLGCPDLKPLDPRAVLGEALDRLDAMLDGIEAWQRHPFRRLEPDLPVVWRDGSSRLLAYGGTGPPVLVLPSLINRAYILDLLPGRSMLRALAASGLRPYLLDWGEPGEAEWTFGLDSYASRRLLPALAAVSVHAGAPPVLMGYCMGGTLAAGLAALGPGITGLVTIGAPWRFTGGRGVAAQMRLAARAYGIGRIETALAQLVEVFGLVPVEILQGLFAAINPIQAARKFRRFAAMDPDSDAARVFVALEDWLADGVPLAGPLAADVMVDWQLRDSPAEGRWRLMGERVNPGRIAVPSLVVTGTADRIAPPAEAGPLAATITDAAHLSVPLGHVAMVAGSKAEETVWRPIGEFIRGIDSVRL